MNYGAIGLKAPWLDVREVGYPVTIDGNDLVGVPFLNAITGDILIGSTGFEADDPYLLVDTADIATFGDLHGKDVIIEGKTYTVRNVREKEGVRMTRLVLNAQ